MRLGVKNLNAWPYICIYSPKFVSFLCWFIWILHHWVIYSILCAFGDKNGLSLSLKYLLFTFQVSIVSCLLSLCSSASDPVVPFFTVQTIVSAIGTVVDGFLEMYNLWFYLFYCHHHYLFLPSSSSLSSSSSSSSSFSSLLPLFFWL